MSRWAMGLGALCLAGAVEAGPQVTLGADPIAAGGIFSTGGGISVAVEPRQIGGVPHLCGVWARSKVLSAYVDEHVRAVLEGGVVQAGDTTLLRDFRQFTQVAPAASYEGARAACVPAAMAGKSALSARLPGRVLSRDRGDEAGVQVRFKPSAKPNPAYTHGSIQAWLYGQISDAEQE